MEKNVGGTDRTVRFIVGSGLVAKGLMSRGLTRSVALGLGVAMLKSAATQKCSVNKTLGINTYQGDADDAGLYPATA